MPIVDTQVAHGLIGVVQAARLLGTEVLLVGIRPEVAQTIIGLGLDLRSVRLPGDPEEASSQEERAIARIAAYARIDDIVRRLYARFLEDRLRPDYARGPAVAQKRWMAGA